ncbi:MAG: hypothetical protein R3229_13735 [Alphaproteobacteria bacterium]|nr:hypothetical protein [Alphaproteobacteria bacterium]
MSEGYRKLSIDRFLFISAFGRDSDYPTEIYYQTAYLDLDNGEMLWVYENDEDAETEAGLDPEENRRDRERVVRDPDRFLDIPGLEHGDHHDILKRFLRSQWTEDEERRLRVEEAYFGSIGGWKKAVDDQDAIDAFYAFQDEAFRELAEEYLMELGIIPIWK